MINAGRVFDLTDLHGSGLTLRVKLFYPNNICILKIGLRNCRK